MLYKLLKTIIVGSLILYALFCMCLVAIAKGEKVKLDGNFVTLFFRISQIIGNLLTVCIFAGLFFGITYVILYG